MLLDHASAGQGKWPAPPSCLSAQPDWAGTIHDRAERRRPFDRRQHQQAVYLDLRCNRGERRRQSRRSLYDPGRRRHPEPPWGVDVWA